MADDITLPGAARVVATDNDGTRDYQWIKVVWGPDDTFNKVDTASGKPFPVQVRSATGLIPLGEPTDAANPATDTTSVGSIALLKQISASVQNRGFSASASFTPAASSHTAGSCNGAAQQFMLSPAPVSGAQIILTGFEMEIDGATAEASAWRLYLYNVTPPSATADAAAWDIPSGDRASFLGYIDLGTAVDLGSTQWVEAHGINKEIKLSGATVFGYLINLTTLTPAAIAHTVKLYGEGR